VSADLVKVIDSAPKVQCARCHVEMTLRTLHPIPNSEKYAATFRCPKCGTDQLLDFAARLTRP
jgi:hypothetical protein